MNAEGSSRRYSGGEVIGESNPAPIPPTTVSALTAGLAATGYLPVEEALPALLSAAVGFVSAQDALLMAWPAGTAESVVRWMDGKQGSAAMAPADLAWLGENLPDLIESAKSDGLAGQNIPVGGLFPGGGDWADASRPDRDRCGSTPRGGNTAVKVRPIINGASGSAALVFIGCADMTEDSDRIVGNSLITAVGSGVAFRFLQGWVEERRRLDSYERLSAHAAAAASAQDVTANGITVALGWMDMLANGQIDGVEREQALISATKRLEAVQGAVHALSESSARLLIQEEEVEALDFVLMWRRVHPFRPGMRGTGQPIALSRPTSLMRFFGRVSNVIVPDLLLDRDSVRLELIDAGRLDLEAKTLMWAAEGDLQQTSNRTFVVWRTPAAAQGSAAVQLDSADS